MERYGRYCWSCHGAEAVVRGGALLARNAEVSELSGSQLESIRQHLRERAAAMRAERPSDKSSEDLP